jgi:hypothetical protein
MMPAGLQEMKLDYFRGYMTSLYLAYLAAAEVENKAEIGNQQGENTGYVKTHGTVRVPVRLYSV